MTDLNGNEKFFDLPGNLPTGASKQRTINSGVEFYSKCKGALNKSAHTIPLTHDHLSARHHKVGLSIFE